MDAVTQQLEALQNAVNYQKTDGLEVLEYFLLDKRKKPQFYLKLQGTTISPVLDYDKMNYFLLGMSRMKQIQTLQN